MFPVTDRTHARTYRTLSPRVHANRWRFRAQVCVRNSLASTYIVTVHWSNANVNSRLSQSFNNSKCATYTANVQHMGKRHGTMDYLMHFAVCSFLQKSATIAQEKYIGWPLFLDCLPTWRVNGRRGTCMANYFTPLIQP